MNDQGETVLHLYLYKILENNLQEFTRGQIGKQDLDGNTALVLNMKDVITTYFKEGVDEAQKQFLLELI